MEWHNIILRMPNWLGDLVMATPVIADVRQAFPKARLTALSATPSLLEDNPYLDEIIGFKKGQHKEAIAHLRQHSYDLGILLTNSFSSAWSFWRGGVKRRLGYRHEGRGILLNAGIPFPKERGREHLVVTYKRLLLPLGISLSQTSPQLFVTEKEREVAQALLRGRKRVIGINPHAAYGPAKCWLPERFREVALRLLEERENTLVFFGDASGKTLVEEICAGMDPRRVMNLAGKTGLRELVALIQACDALLTNDSGPMHIAAAVKTPLVALFGSTSDVATSPYLFGKVIHKHVSCSPCYLRTCPIDFKCMKRIEVDEVLEEVKKILELKETQTAGNLASLVHR